MNQHKQLCMQKLYEYAVIKHNKKRILTQALKISGRKTFTDSFNTDKENIFGLIFLFICLCLFFFNKYNSLKLQMEINNVYIVSK